MKKLKQTKKNKKGFTFIELLSVIVILSILVTFCYVGFSSSSFLTLALL